MHRRKVAVPGFRSLPPRFRLQYLQTTSDGLTLQSSAYTLISIDGQSRRSSLRAPAGPFLTPFRLLASNLIESGMQLAMR
jgi:hypothetical protein